MPFLPTTKKEAERLGWSSVDVVLFSGDAYVDHPSFGAAVIGRVLQAEGLKVAIVPQPNWQDDLRDFKKFGEPNLFFAISAGCMDSKVNHYTANRRLRSNDAYTPMGKAGFRPDDATIVYSNILKNLFPKVPVVIGGIEASLRRLSHYDYWDNKLRQSILIDSKADILIYGMGEKPIVELVKQMREKGVGGCKKINQVGWIANKIVETDGQTHILNSFEDCVRDKSKSAQNFRVIEEESNRYHAKTLVQPTGDKYVVINPPFEPMTTEELDRIHALPFTRLPHPKYRNKVIPAYEMIKHSVNTHRGCFGGCSFCTISAHQGKFIISRSRQSILDEVVKITQLPDFKGYISDLGGPSANMYWIKGKDFALCKKCSRPSCIFPSICKNLNINHSPMIDLYKEVDSLPRIKKSFISSGVRYDMLMHTTGDKAIDSSLKEYAEELIKNHVSGRLKVAPEHSSKHVLNSIRKPSFALFVEFSNFFDNINKKHSLSQQLIPYFISSLPLCSPIDMAELAIETKKMNFRLEQVQDFTPTPMTLSTEMFYTGIDPYSMKKVFVTKTAGDKQNQKIFFFHYQKQYKKQILAILSRFKRLDLINKLFGNKP